jgi:putative aminopeptidase FrvX
MDLLANLKALCEASGIAGFEGGVKAVVRSQWEPLVDELRQDALGNLIVIRRGRRPEGQPARSILLAGHCDEVGLVVSGMERGFLRIMTVGGVDPRVLPGQEVTVHGRQPLAGVIGLRPPHVVPAAERKKPAPLNELWVDVGLDQEQAQALIDLGDPITLHAPATALLSERLAAKALDDRAGVAVLSVCLEHLQSMRHTWDVYAVATTQEELGMRGAMVSAFGLMPDIAIAVDVTFGEQPGVSEEESFKMDGGPTIAIGPNVHPAMHAGLVETAKALEIPYQIEPLPASSGTDGWAIQVTREGIPTAVVSIPLQNMHTAVEVAALSDIRRAGRLLAAFISGLDETFMQKLTDAFKAPAGKR